VAGGEGYAVGDEQLPGDEQLLGDERRRKTGGWGISRGQGGEEQHCRAAGGARRRGGARPASRRSTGGDEQMAGGNPSSPSYPSRPKSRRAGGNPLRTRAQGPFFHGIARSSALRPSASPPRRLEPSPRRLAPPSAQIGD